MGESLTQCPTPKRPREGAIRLQDQAGIHVFPFKIRTMISRVQTPGVVFNNGGTRMIRDAETYLGQFTTAQGKPFLAGINYNTDHNRFAIVDLSREQDTGYFYFYENRFLMKAN